MYGLFKIISPQNDTGTMVTGGEPMNAIQLKIKCWKCGREEVMLEANEEKAEDTSEAKTEENIAEKAVQVNFEKLCPNCLVIWLEKWDIMMEKSTFDWFY